jgi:hypothetical protein
MDLNRKKELHTVFGRQYPGTSEVSKSRLTAYCILGAYSRTLGNGALFFLASLIAATSSRAKAFIRIAGYEVLDHAGSKWSKPDGKKGGAQYETGNLCHMDVGCIDIRRRMHGAGANGLSARRPDAGAAIEACWADVRHTGQSE